MRVTSVDLYSPNFAEAITFSLRESDPNSQYMVRSILGIDAENLIPKFYGFGIHDRPRFYDFGMDPREIVIRVVLNPRYHLDESVSDIRDELYRAISATRTGQVTLFFNAGTTIVASIKGFIRKFEVPYFSELPEVQITIRCDDPMFRGVNPVIFEPADLTANPILIPDSLSTAPHGFTMQITFTEGLLNFIMEDALNNQEWMFRIFPSGGGFQAGDVLQFSSEYSNKSLYRVRGTTTTYLMDRVVPSSVWPILFPGANTFYFEDRDHFTIDSLQFYAAYWGV